MGKITITKEELKAAVAKAIAYGNAEPTRLNAQLGLELADCSTGVDEAVAGPGSVGTAGPETAAGPGSVGTAGPETVAGLDTVAGPETVNGNDPWVEFIYNAREEHLNPYGGVHGGIISALADTCSGIGAVALTGRFVTTTDLQMSFLRAMTGKRYRIHIDYTHVGRSLIRCMGKIYDESGNLTATSMATFMGFEGLPPGIRD